MAKEKMDYLMEQPQWRSWMFNHVSFDYSLKCYVGFSPTGELLISNSEPKQFIRDYSEATTKW